MLKIKSEDEVIILAGKDKGKRGKVRRVLDDNRVLVSGVNMVKKHTKANPQAGVAGGIVENEAPIQISNVAIFLCSWAAIKIPMLMFETKFLGLKFSMLRLILTIPSAILIGLIMEKVLVPKNAH